MSAVLTETKVQFERRLNWRDHVENRAHRCSSTRDWEAQVLSYSRMKRGGLYHLRVSDQAAQQERAATCYGSEGGYSHRVKLRNNENNGTVQGVEFWKGSGLPRSLARAVIDSLNDN